jgi:hypothetical protein
VTLYGRTGTAKYEDLLARLGKYKTGVFCLYLNHLDDVDEQVLREMLKRTLEYMQNKED